ncbi:hypothetical protein MBLNU459_g5357t1 [Dothideomycetes sp. NU459]
MRMRLSLAHALLCLSYLGSFASAAARKQPSNSVLLSNVKTLTLRKDAQTSARRVAAIPQLKNAGSDYDENNVQWTCQASLPPEFKLGSTDVICEGYDSPDDPYILKGSCGVEYRLVLTEQGEAKYGHREDHGQAPTTRSEKLMFYGCLTFILSVICYGIWAECTGRNRRPGANGGGGWGGGWGGGDDDNDPPPPYTPRASKWARSNQRNNQGWRPGFWSGTAAGAAAGYFAGNRANRQPDPQVGSSRWANRGSGGGRSSSPPSSSRYESTGFGGTTRR